MTLDLFAAACFDLGRKPWIDPAVCPGHVFLNGRCVHCNLHRFHLPALEQLKPPDADAGNLPCPSIGGQMSDQEHNENRGVAHTSKCSSN